jgi:hypothetical protein
MEEKRIIQSEYGYSYIELAFENWKEICKHLLSWDEHGFNRLENFVFRGHSDSKWELEPTLERIRPDLEDYDFKEWYIKAEKISIDNYKRGVKLFANDKENRFIANDITQLDWLSIMQHHGAGTRLLDATRSPLIAAFFACADVNCVTKERCIWAIPLKIINEQNYSIIRPETRDKYNDLYDYYQDVDVTRQDDESIIGYSFLNMLSERPFYQQGAFLYSMSNTIRFTNLLKKYYDDDTKLTKMTFRLSSRKDFELVFKDLRNMNITYSSLFPGIDGYSKDIYLEQYIRNTPHNR